ncbi:MAG: hypothetical protein ACYDB9_03290 [Gammaproteobacteria bacterium]
MPQKTRIYNRKSAVKQRLRDILMFGFALVPLYRAICRLTWLDGHGAEAVSTACAGDVLG